MSTQHYADVRADEAPHEVIGRLRVSFDHWMQRPHYMNFELRGLQSALTVQVATLTIGAFRDERGNESYAFRVKRAEWARMKDRL